MKETPIIKPRYEFEADRINLILAFMHVAESLSFTRASELSGIESSTLSRRVSRLEDSLKVRLFSRTTRSVALTEAGRIYLEQCARFMDALAEADAQVSASNRVPRGLLRVTMPVALGERHLTQMISRYLSLHPEVQIEANFTDRFVDLVGEKYDIGIRTGRIPDSGIVTRKLADNRRFLVAAPTYLEQHGVPLKPQDLLDHNCLRFSRYRSTWHFTDGENETELSLSGSLISDSSEAIYNAVLGGVGVGFVAEYMCHRDLAEGRLVPLLSGFISEPVAGIYAVFPTRRYLPSKSRSFLDFVVRYFREPAWPSK